MEDSSISLTTLSQEKIHIAITVVEETEPNNWTQPREASLFPELRELKNNQTSSTVIIFCSLPEKSEGTEKFLESLRPGFEQESHFFPPEFLEVVFADLNGTFYCNNTADQNNPVTEHVSWSCFKIKHVEAHSKYVWIQPAVFVRWNPPTSKQIVFCLRLPEDLQNQMLAKKPHFASRQYNPFVWHTLFTQGVVDLYDKSVWRLRDVVRDVEKKRNTHIHSFPDLHDIARHIFHSNETLEVAQNTMQNLVDEQDRWRTEHRGLVDRNRGAWNHTYQKALHVAKSLHSFLARSNSLDSRLRNEINLAFNVVNQTDSSMMKTIAVVSLVFLPGTFISGLFGTNFFSIGEGKTNMSNNFWLYWAITVPITLGTVMVWAIVHYLPARWRKLRDRSKKRSGSLV